MSVADNWFAPWGEPYPPAVVEIANRIDGRELKLCKHIDEPATYTEHRMFVFARFPNELACAQCVALLVGAFAAAEEMAGGDGILRLNRCDRCEVTRTPSHRRSVRAGNVLVVIELCDPCVNGETGPQTKDPAPEDLDRRDDEIGRPS